MSNNNYGPLLLIIGIVFLIFLIKAFWHRTKWPTCSGVLITGSMGSGKTLNSVKQQVSWYRKHRRKYRAYQFFTKIPLWGKPVASLVGHSWEPHVYTNFPLCLCRKHPLKFWSTPQKRPHDFIWADVLKREHVLMQEDLPEYSAGIFDELGLCANQWSYDDDNIQSRNINESFETLEVFVKFLRHFYTGDNSQFIFCEQTASAIAKPLRSRIGYDYNLVKSYRWLGFTPFLISEVNIMLNSEDNLQNVNNVSDVEGESQPYFFRWIGYRIPLLSYKNYESRCYLFANQYNDNGQKNAFTYECPCDNWADNPHGFYTNYVPDLRMTEKERFDRDVKLAIYRSDVRRQASLGY